MNISTTYEGRGYLDSNKRVITQPRGDINLYDMPDHLDHDSVTKWLWGELATICTILCSHVFKGVQERLLAINKGYRETITGTIIDAYNSETGDTNNGWNQDN